ncbi:dopamine receptor D2b isoform X2 [Chanodichthys erythropterus]|uniref:dopamine receptor D2b isoform X2 n=1 Tax=Chanodichthys erythropterus TaxID=933992 RepID=UPI00351EF6E8
MDFLTEYPYNDTYYDNGTGTLNGTSCEAKHQYNYYAMLLTLLIFVIVFGNVLVCMAVSREKALQTTTNYLIVSLAVADLLVATLVMPWVVYLEVVGEWRFSKIHCDIFVTLDVMMCTASILNLCAISIDRYTAVAMPMLYNTRYSSKRRVTVMISVVWVLSFAISCPLLFGLNNTATRDGAVCEIANPAFVVYSSIMSFYVPFIITLLVYVQIYVVLRKRRKRVNTKRSCQKTDADAQPSLKEVLHPGGDVGVDIVAGTSPPEKKKQASTLVVDLMANPSPIHASPSHGECQSNGDEKNGHTKEVQIPKEAKPVETQALPNGKTLTTVTKTMSKRKISQHKEKKATQMLAIVLGVFIICWLPFFITHILKTHCTSCVVPLEMYNAFTWLGYVNSAVNPIIYTTFNVEFRKAFIKILHC